MTLPPHKIGDKGQRYKSSVLGWPEDDWNALFYSDDYDGIKKATRRMARSNPQITAYRVEDRQKNITETTFMDRS